MIYLFKHIEKYQNEKNRLLYTLIFWRCHTNCLVMLPSDVTAQFVATKLTGKGPGAMLPLDVVTETRVIDEFQATFLAIKFAIFLRENSLELFI